MDGLDEAIANVLRFIFSVERDATQADFALCSD
jgi:hypothetical protein